MCLLNCTERIRSPTLPYERCRWGAVAVTVRAFQAVAGWRRGARLPWKVQELQGYHSLHADTEETGSEKGTLYICESGGEQS